MTTTSRKFFETIQAAHQHLKSAGFTLVDITHPFGWAHFARCRAASVRWSVSGYYVLYIAI